MHARPPSKSRSLTDHPTGEQPTPPASAQPRSFTLDPASDFFSGSCETVGEILSRERGYREFGRRDKTRALELSQLQDHLDRASDEPSKAKWHYEIWRKIVYNGPIFYHIVSYETLSKFFQYQYEHSNSKPGIQLVSLWYFHDSFRELFQLKDNPAELSPKLQAFSVNLQDMLRVKINRAKEEILACLPGESQSDFDANAINTALRLCSQMLCLLDNKERHSHGYQPIRLKKTKKPPEEILETLWPFEDFKSRFNQIYHSRSIQANDWRSILRQEMEKYYPDYNLQTFNDRKYIFEMLYKQYINLHYLVYFPYVLHILEKAYQSAVSPVKRLTTRPQPALDGSDTDSHDVTLATQSNPLTPAHLNALEKDIKFILMQFRIQYSSLTKDKQSGSDIQMAKTLLQMMQSILEMLQSLHQRSSLPQSFCDSMNQENDVSASTRRAIPKQIANMASTWQSWAETLSASCILAMNTGDEHDASCYLYTHLFYIVSNLIDPVSASDLKENKKKKEAKRQSAGLLRDDQEKIKCIREPVSLVYDTLFDLMAIRTSLYVEYVEALKTLRRIEATWITDQLKQNCFFVVPPENITKEAVTEALRTLQVLRERVNQYQKADIQQLVQPYSDEWGNYFLDRLGKQSRLPEMIAVLDPSDHTLLHFVQFKKELKQHLEALFVNDLDRCEEYLRARKRALIAAEQQQAALPPAEEVAPPSPTPTEPVTQPITITQPESKAPPLDKTKARKVLVDIAIAQSDAYLKARHQRFWLRDAIASLFAWLFTPEQTKRKKYLEDLNQKLKAYAAAGDEASTQTVLGAINQGLNQFNGHIMTDIFLKSVQAEITSLETKLKTSPPAANTDTDILIESMREELFNQEINACSKVASSRLWFTFFHPKQCKALQTLSGKAGQPNPVSIEKAIQDYGSHYKHDLRFRPLMEVFTLLRK